MQRNYFIVVLIFFIFFVISFLTNIIGPLVPEVIKGFSVSKGMAGLLNFSFFIAYGVMSVPAGMLTEKYREKKVITAAFRDCNSRSTSVFIFPVLWNLSDFVVYDRDGNGSFAGSN